MVLLCAPAVAALPAAVAALTSHVSVASRMRTQRRLYGALLLAEKLRPDAPGGQRIAEDIDRQTLHVAYLAQYPQRAKEIVHLGLLGAVVVATAIAYYIVYYPAPRSGASLMWLLILLGALAVAALWCERAVLNFARNDRVARALFVHFGAPDGLIRPRTELMAKSPPLSLETVFERAADIRDAHHDGAMTTLAAVNAVLAKAHTHFDWRHEARRAGQRVVHVDYRGHAATGYDWMLRHLLAPLFAVRLRALDATERHRAARAERSGDVFQAAWLAVHYRNERRRLAEHWDYLQTWHRTACASRRSVSAQKKPSAVSL